MKLLMRIILIVHKYQAFLCYYCLGGHIIWPNTVAPCRYKTSTLSHLINVIVILNTERN
jgi:hypothetical protein